MKDTSAKPARRSIMQRVTGLFDYLTTGIWSDSRRSWWLNVLRTVNLSVSSFLSRDIQTQACAMTYRTMLAVVPALALIIAIGRGFGIQNILEDELFKLFPAQRQAIQYSMNFVDSYLSQTSEGLFLGLGLLFLLWTLISLLSSVEDTFNYIWGQKTGRSMWRKVSDYTAMMLILPMLMLCAAGLSLLLSTSLQQVLHFSFMTPLVSIFVEGGKWVMTCLFFAAVYLLIPNTRVPVVNALISGALAGTGFIVLQWLFLTGTLYVTKYNAIYGSLAFLPLLMLWMQLAWVVTMAGAVVCYSSQNVFAFSLDREAVNISNRYHDMVSMAIAAVIARRFMKHERAATAHDLINLYGIPARLVTDVTGRLCSAGIVNRVLLPDVKDEYGFQLAVDPSQFTVACLRDTLRQLGTSDIINNFNSNFPGVEPLMQKIDAAVDGVTDGTLVYTLCCAGDPAPAADATDASATTGDTTDDKSSAR